MRAFIAIKLSKEVRDNLALVKNLFLKDYPEIKWVPQDNLHLTLKFLGDISRGDLDKVKSALADVCSGMEPFSIRVKGAGVFPGLRNPKVFWAGIYAEPSLMLLAKRIYQNISFGDNKKFHPHITLGRIKNEFSQGERLIRLSQEQFPEGWGRFDVTEINLKESILLPAGPNYKNIQKYYFK